MNISDDFCKINEPLANYSTMRIGGNAKYLFLPRNYEEFFFAIRFCEHKKLKIAILGNGSNTLCSSLGFDGGVICTKKMNLHSKKHIRFLRTRHFIIRDEDKSNTRHSQVDISKKAQCKAFVLRIKYRHIYNNSSEIFSLAQYKLKILHFRKKLQKRLQKMISFCDFCGIIKYNYVLVQAQCGKNLMLLCRQMCEMCLSGLEFSAGIPASVGGACKMNAGAFGGQISDNVYRVLVYNQKNKSIYYKYNFSLDANVLRTLNCVHGINWRLIHSKNITKLYDIMRFTAIFGKKFIFKGYKSFISKLEYGYRYSNFLDEEFILCVEFVLRKSNISTVSQKLDDIICRRRSSQNVGYPSLGSVFKRQDSVIPAKLIDNLGLKGLRVGGAMISKNHAGFIVNYDNATSFDILNLVNFVQHIICKKYNIVLQYELKFLGDFYEQS